MNYKIRDGIVYETICGEHMLIATFKARKYCPYIYELNEASVMIWKCLIKGYELEQIAEEATHEFDINYDDALDAVQQFIAELEKQGYLEKTENVI